VKDTLERATEPTLDLKAYLKDAYIHPVFQSGEQTFRSMDDDVEEKNSLVPTKRTSQRGSPSNSRYTSEQDTS
jgi:calcium permeable stress-gated cation channel